MAITPHEKIDQKDDSLDPRLRVPIPPHQWPLVRRAAERRGVHPATLARLLLLEYAQTVHQQTLSDHQLQRNTLIFLMRQGGCHTLEDLTTQSGLPRFVVKAHLSVLEIEEVIRIEFRPSNHLVQKQQRELDEDEWEMPAKPKKRAKKRGTELYYLRDER